MIIARYRPKVNLSTSEKSTPPRKGDGVWHPKHGNGKIIDVDRGKITVQFWERYQGPGKSPIPDHTKVYSKTRDLSGFQERLNQWFLKRNS